MAGNIVRTTSVTAGTVGQGAAKLVGKVEQIAAELAQQTRLFLQADQGFGL